MLAADTAGPDRPGLRRAIWRFTGDPDAALNLVLSHEADLLETAIGPERASRAAAASGMRVISYPSAAYGFLGFNLFDRRRSGPHPVLGDRETRRGLAMGVERSVLARSVFGEEAKAPPGPMSRLLWIWSDSIRTLPYDTVAARTTLEAAGWRLGGGETIRRRGSQRLAFDILVPSTSGSRRQLAVQLQEAWRRLGAEVTVTAVDFAVFQERLGKGQFDSYIGAWLDEPTPRGLADQWSRAGWAAINHGRYDSPSFDSLARPGGAGAAGTGGRRALPAGDGVCSMPTRRPSSSTPRSTDAVVAKRVEGVEIDPYSWISGLREWKVTPP